MVNGASAVLVAAGLYMSLLQWACSICFCWAHIMFAIVDALP